MKRPKIKDLELAQSLLQHMVSKNSAYSAGYARVADWLETEIHLMRCNKTVVNRARAIELVAGAVRQAWLRDPPPGLRVEQSAETHVRVLEALGLLNLEGD
jgi:hypothetical protein